MASLTHAGPFNAGAGVQIDATPRSMKAIRDENVVRQAKDFSCGAAALATLLSYGLDDSVSEDQILADLFSQLSNSDATVRQSTGFSLLDMQMVAQRRGYRAQAFRLAPQDLANLTGPVIVFIEPQGYKHFAVLRGVQGDRVFLADPSRGYVRMPAYQFMQIWLGSEGTGIIFVVEPQTATATASQRNALSILPSTLPQPELLSARELLAVGASSSRPYGLNR